MSKPAMLQINVAGSWRNVVEFDVADTNSADLVMEAGATLAAHGLGAPKVRVVRSEGGYAHPLMRWDSQRGWIKWRDRNPEGVITVQERAFSEGT